MSDIIDIMMVCVYEPVPYDGEINDYLVDYLSLERERYPHHGGHGARTARVLKIF